MKKISLQKNLEALQKYNIKHIKSTPYHPQSQGLIERSNKTLSEKLRIYCQDPTEWDLDLKFILLAINISINKTTRKSPFFLMHGFEPKPTLNNKWRLSPIPGTTSIHKERNKARARIHREQQKSRLRRSIDRERISFVEDFCY